MGIKLMQFANRTTFFAIGIIFCLVGIGFFVGFISGKSTMAAPTTPGTCLSTSKGGTGCFDAEFFDRIYPIGSVYTSTDSVNPGDKFGGVWESFGAGRTLIGVGNNGTNNYTAAETTGGVDSVALSNTQIPQHNHQYGIQFGEYFAAIAMLRNDANSFFGLYNNGAWEYSATNQGSVAGSLTNNANATTSRVINSTRRQVVASTGANSSSINGASHENRSSYITVYFWKRVS